MGGPSESFILLADDDENDRLFFRLAVETAGLSNPIMEFANGQGVIDYLKVPCSPASLLVLDLKMPRASGFDVLAWLRTRPELSQLPVVILSASEQEEDVRKALALGAVDYRVKPTHHDELIQFVGELNERWLAGHTGVL